MAIRISRLIDDVESLTWLLYEQGGYPLTENGKHIDSKAFNVATKYGRGYTKDSKKFMFTELVGELESRTLT